MSDHDPLCAYTLLERDRDPDEVYLRHRRMGDSEAVCVEAVTNAVEANVRERIAQQIEAHAERVGAVDPPPQQDDYYAALHDAAAIARGEQP